MSHRVFHVESGETAYRVGLPTTQQARMLLDEQQSDITIEALPGRRYLVRGADGKVWTVDVTGKDGTLRTTCGAVFQTWHVESERDRALGGSGRKGGGATGDVGVSMPGKIVKVMVAVGDSVEEGDALFIAEAMKMENEIKAPCSGQIQEVALQVGATVEPGSVLVRIEPGE